MSKHRAAMRAGNRRLSAACVLVLVAMTGALTATAQSPDLAARVRWWESLSPDSRRDAREQMQSWLRLPPRQQAALRESAAAFAALPASEQDALRRRFEALPGEQRHGWRLGPALGAYYPRLHPLLAYVPEAQREPLLQVLHSMPPQELEQLGRLAFSTPPSRRDALRQALIRQPASGRMRWLLTELER
ncbi:DUF3106 domain-containing protein [Luteimonas sp. e5]